MTRSRYIPDPDQLVFHEPPIRSQENEARDDFGESDCVVKLLTLVSGSSGNAYLMRSPGGGILLDAGLTLRQFKGHLEALGCPQWRPQALLLTHEHSDHTRGFEAIARAFQLPIYASEGTIKHLMRTARHPERLDFRRIQSGDAFEVGDIQVHPYAIYHDASEPLAYRFAVGQARWAVMTDTGQVDTGWIAPLGACQLLFVEANYEEGLLMAGRYPYRLKQRINGDYGHLSNLQAADLIASCTRLGCQRYVLVHLSQENNLPELAQLQISTYLRQKGLKASVEVAPRYQPSTIYRLACV